MFHRSGVAKQTTFGSDLPVESNVEQTLAKIFAQQLAQMDRGQQARVGCVRPQDGSDLVSSKTGSGDQEPDYLQRKL